MKYTCLPEHKDFFAKKGFLLFEEMISDTSPFVLEAEKIINNRAKQKAFSSETEKSYLLGRNLWEDSPLFKKLAMGKKYAHLIKELCNKKSLTIALDQLLKIEDFANPLQETLAKSFCIDPLLCCLVFCLDSHDQMKRGSGLILQPDTPQSFSKGLFYIIAYCQSQATYQDQENDLNRYYLKRKGLSFGSFASGSLFPRLF